MSNTEMSETANGGPPPKEMQRRRSSLYLNVRMPHKPDRPSITGEGHLAEGDENEEYFPSEKVQNLLYNVRDPKHRTHKVFCEMDVLKKRGEDYEWRETARWVKYEETVEEGGKRWSKPHVASLSMHHIMRLRAMLMEGAVILDADAYSISQVIEMLLDEWIKTDSLEPVLRQHIRTLALKHHRHRHERGRPEKKLKNTSTNPDLRRAISAGSFSTMHPLPDAPSSHSLSSHFGSEHSLESMDSDNTGYSKKPNERFMRKLPKGAEVANIMIGETDDLEQEICGFMRLNDARMLGDLCEVPLPTRFMFFIFGPSGQMKDYQEIGRAMATMLVDDVCREVAYKCRDIHDLVAGIDEFVEQVTVLPPGEWDPKIRIEPPDRVPNQEFRKTPSSHALLERGMVPKPPEEGEPESHADPSLVFSGRPFLGLIRDIKAKIPWYPSDFKDALHVQCIASFIYIFLATLTPNVTFGGMLGKETDQYMGVMECIFAAAVSGIAFALFSGQPLNILGSTGPMLVLEKILYTFCKDNHWDFLPFRAWVGIWTAGFILLIVMFDMSALVRYITRFTEESFACLIALIFIYEAFVKLFEIAHEDAPVLLHPADNIRSPICACHAPIINNTAPMNMTDLNGTTMATTTLSGLAVTNSSMAMDIGNVTWNSLNQTMCDLYEQYGAHWTCHNPHAVPDVFMFSIILFAGTFGIAIFLVTFKNWPCFPSIVRQLLSDFGVLIAILVMVGVDIALGLPTTKLIVPKEFKPTRPDRTWIVNPISDKNPWWLPIAGGLPAILATILIFMDQQITAVIVNRKENKLKKGKGYHLDMLVVCILVLAHSLLGLPWYVAATVSAIAHIQSLRKESECTAPGDKPAFLGVREQRVTALLVGILSGVAVLITNVLKVIPMPVLYGVFFYMGFQALRGMQFIDRILLFLMPVKYQPDYPYLRHVPLWRVHIFTCIQIVCLIGLWVVKSVKSISIVFPLLVVATGIVRKVLEKVFTTDELKWLDDIMPSNSKDKKEGKQKKKKNKNKAEIGNSNEGGYFKQNGDKVANNEKPAFYLAEEGDVNSKKQQNGHDDNEGAHKRNLTGHTNPAFDTKL